MRYLSLDYEGFLMQPGCQAPPIVCAIVAYDDEPGRIIHVRDPELNALIYGAVRDPNTTIIAHYAPHEYLSTLAHRPECVTELNDCVEANRFQCTILRDKLLRIGRGHVTPASRYGLDDCLEYHGSPILLNKEDPWRLRFGTLIDTPVSEWPAAAKAYALGDMAVRDLWVRQERAAKLDGRDYYADHAHQMCANVALALGGAWGMRVDLAKAETVIANAETTIATAQALILAEGLAKWVTEKGVARVKKETKRAHERMAAVCAALERPVVRGDITPKRAAKGITEGYIVLDEEACLATGDEVLAAYTTFGQASTLRSKVARLRRAALADQPIQPSYDPLMKTGRTSSRLGDDPALGEAWSAYGSQIQNPPKVGGVRECFVARPGHAIVSIDFDAFELRTWAQVCIEKLGYSDMAEVLRDPKRCAHVEMGALAVGITPEAAYALKKTDPKRFKSLRALAKVYNFSAPGGGGAETLAEIARSAPYFIPTTKAEAAANLEVWRRTWREAGAYLGLISKMVGRRGNRITIEHALLGPSGTFTPTSPSSAVLGKPDGPVRYRGDTGYCDSANSFFQGRAADAAKAGLWAVTREWYENRSSPAYGCRLLGFVHDEILVETPLWCLHDAAYRTRDVFVAAAQKWVPDVPLTASPAAMFCWSKEAGDPVHDAAGRLICWEDRDKG